MIEQGTEEWLQQRCAKVTASRIADLTARTRSGWGASRANYMAELIAERLTGKPTEKYVNAAMEHGTRTEPEARNVYSFMWNVTVDQVGFIDHPRIAMSGASPDGCIGDKGLIEIKAPQIAKHLDTLLNETVDDRYVKQMAWQMSVTGREYCDFVSYCPALPVEMRLWVRRFERDDKLISELEEQVQEFLSELDAKVKALRDKYEAKEMAA
jgi:putative phage-type endonuclease